MIKGPVPLDKKTAERLSKVRSTNTSIERQFRKVFRVSGIKGVYASKAIIGKPDFANKAAKVAVFLDGCFWHGHSKCYKEPVHNKEYWQNKVWANKERRRKVRRQLKKDGWLILEFWECTARKGMTKIANKVEQAIKQRSVLSH